MTVDPTPFYTAPDHESEPPRPLCREIDPAEPFPLEALGGVLGPAATAIEERVRAPVAICGQSVLAVATLAVQGHANVELPWGARVPVSDFFVSVAATGERKTAVDRDAMWPVRKREEALRQANEADLVVYQNNKDVHEKARAAILTKAKDTASRDSTRADLEALGKPPAPPLTPMLTCPEPTWASRKPSTAPMIGASKITKGTTISSSKPPVTAPHFAITAMIYRRPRPAKTSEPMAIRLFGSGPTQMVHGQVVE